jgi:hypothetical protein
VALLEGVEGGDFSGHHVTIEIGRPADGLAGVVDDEVEPLAALVPGQQKVAEGLDAGGVAQVEAEDLETVGPARKIGFAGVAQRRVARETRGHDQVRTRAQELESGLVADLHPPAGEQGDPAGEIGRLLALSEVEVAAIRAELVVEVMQRPVVLLAGVAVTLLEQHTRRRFERLWELPGRAVDRPVGRFVDVLCDEAGWRVDVGRGDRGLAPQLADPHGVEETLVLAHLLRAALPGRRLHQPAASARVGMRHLPRRPQEALAILVRDLGEQAAVGLDGLEELGRRPHPGDQGALQLLPRRGLRRLVADGLGAPDRSLGHAAKSMRRDGSLSRGDATEFSSGSSEPS